MEEEGMNQYVAMTLR